MPAIRIEVSETVRKDFRKLVRLCPDFRAGTSLFPPLVRRLLSQAKIAGSFHPESLFILDEEESKAIEILRQSQAISPSSK